MMSGDKIAGRKPYGFTTRMLALVGWKRIETNRMLDFHGVTSTNFPSLMRRTLVWEPRSRFKNPKLLSERFPNHMECGVFGKIDNLKRFLGSGPAIAAGLRLQFGWERRTTRDEAAALIEEYVSGGLDNGLTEDTLRAACRLPPRDKRRHRTAEEEGLQLSTSPADPATPAVEVKDAWTALADAVRDKCLAAEKNSLTSAMFNYVTLPADTPNMNRGTLWTQLKAKGLMRSVSTQGRKGDNAMAPLVQHGVGLVDIVDVTVPPVLPSLQEHIRVWSLEQYLHGHPGCMANATVLMQFHDNMLKFWGKPKRGNRSKKEHAELLLWQDEKEKFESTYRMAENLLAAVNRVNEDVRSASQSSNPPQRKRIKTTASEDHRFITVSYRMTLDGLLRTRMQANFPSCQPCARRVLRHAVPDTVDLDIGNCALTIWLQLVVKLKARVPDTVMSTLRQCAEDRETVCRKDFACSVPEGKQLLQKLLNGGAPPADLADNPMVRKVRQLGRWLGWLAATLLPEVYKKCVQDEKPNPETSTAFYLWSAVEDVILHAWLAFAQRREFQHISLHYDGLRLAPLQGDEVALFCRQSEQHILDKTGFSVKITEKKHRHFLEWLLEQSREQVVSPPQDCIS